MSDDDRKAFISYRRALSSFFARAVYQHLTGQGYDVFMDVESLDGGEFRRIILGQIDARPHFLALLTPGALARTTEPGDWLRQEIEHALELGRNVVPLLGEGFTFEAEREALPGGRFPGKLDRLAGMSGINVHPDYFDEAMGRLTKRFLKRPAHGPLVPTAPAERAVVQRLMANAARAQPGPEGRGWQWLGQLPLPAPKLELAKEAPPGKRVWRWNRQLGATSYVLQRSADESFAEGKEVYRGEATEFAEDTGLLPTSGYYRVMATGGFAFADSCWSNVVRAAPWWDEWVPRPASSAPGLEVTPEPLAPKLPPLVALHRARRGLGSAAEPLLPSALSAHVAWRDPLRAVHGAPSLRVDVGRHGQRIWRWTPVYPTFERRGEPIRYVLQASADGSFAAPRELYVGGGLEFSQSSLHDPKAIAAVGRKGYYRVGVRYKAATGAWSNVVEA